MGRRAKHDRELREEIASHLAMQADDNVRAGMTPAEARRAALLRFGGVEVTREAYRDHLTLPRVEQLARDMRIALRQLRRSPGFALTAILVLALGLGASVAIFAFVDAVLIEPLPYRDPSRLVGLFESTPLGPRFHLSYPDYLDWRREARAFSALEAYEPHAFRLAAPEGAQQVDGVRVSAGFLRTLGVTPVLGRDFREGEDLPAAAPTVLLTHAIWQTRFGGRDEVLDRTVLLDDRPHTIIGVLPRTFHFAPAGAPELWASLEPRNAGERGSHDLSGLARLKDGVTPQAAAADLAVVAQRLAARYPDSNRDRGATLVLLTELIVGETRPVLLMLLAGAGLLLLIAAVNVASLLLVRAENRKREIALRTALGASRTRLLSQFATESFVLVAIASSLAWLAASAALYALAEAIPAARAANMPYLQALGLNGRAAVFLAIIATVIAMLVAATPALRLAPGDMREGLTEAGRGASSTTWRRLGGRLVAIELATAMILLVAAGLLGQSFVRLMRVDTGLQPEQLSTMLVTGVRAAYPDDTRLVAVTRRLVSRLASLPGVTSVGLANDLPVGNGGGTSPLSVIGPSHATTAGAPGSPRQEVNVRWVSARYFTTLRARLIRGRFFDEAEDTSRPRVAIVNQTLARRIFGNADPLGRRVSYEGPDAAMEIVGVVHDIKEGPLDQATQPALYVPFEQGPGGRLFLVARTAGDDPGLLTTMQAVVREIDPRLAISRQGTMRERIQDSPSAYLRQAGAWLVGGFAAVALLLGAIGLYGVVTYSVGQRTREIGVRMAIGAQRADIYRLILGEALHVILLGLALGLAGSMTMAGLMRGLLFEIGAWDAPTMIVVTLVLGGVALLGSFLPARRAASVNPLDALRAP